MLPSRGGSTRPPGRRPERSPGSPHCWAGWKPRPRVVSAAPRGGGSLLPSRDVRLSFHSAPLAPPEWGKGWWKSSSSRGLWWPRGVTVISCGAWLEHSDHLKDCCLVDLSFSWYAGRREWALCGTLCWSCLCLWMFLGCWPVSLVPFPLRISHSVPGKAHLPSQKWKSQGSPLIFATAGNGCPTALRSALALASLFYCERGAFFFFF